MGESLIQSWLKHAKECKITQLNWKPSANWTTYNDQSIEELYRRMSECIIKRTINHPLEISHLTITLRQIYSQKLPVYLSTNHNRLIYYKAYICSLKL